MIIFRRWISEKFENGTIIAPIILIFLMAVDFYAFYMMFILGGQFPELSIMMATLLALAVNLVPYFLITAILTHFGPLSSLSIDDTQKDKFKLMKRISLIVIVSATLATLALLAWVTWMRYDIIDESGRNSMAAFTTAAEIGEVITDNQNPSPGEIIGNAGFIQHWLLVPAPTVIGGDPGAIFEESFGFYLGFYVDRILLISPLITTFVAMFLSALFFRGDRWLQTLIRIVGLYGYSEGDERHRREEELQRRDRLLNKEKEAHRRAETKAQMKFALSEYRRAQRISKREMDRAEKVIKRLDSRQEPQNRTIKKLENDIEVARLEMEECSKVLKEKQIEHARMIHEQSDLKAEIWNVLQCTGDVPSDDADFTSECTKIVMKRVSDVAIESYGVRHQEFCGRVEANLRKYRETLLGLARTRADEYSIEEMSRVSIEDIINEYNEGKPALQQWNTELAREALLQIFRKNLGIQ